MSLTDGQSRRAVLGGMAAGAGLMAMATESNAQSPSPTPTTSLSKTFVLVHGAWHGGWCWRRVADRLEGKGHKVFVPTMTGLGERSHLLTKGINLDTHVTDIVNVLKWEDLKDIVLVGHSYGGIIVSGVADQAHDKISSIVFLDAFVPEDGDSLYEKASAAAKGGMTEALNKGEISMKPIPAAVFRVNEKDRAWVDAKCTPQPIGTLTDKAKVTGGREKIAKRTYIRAKGYPSVPFDATYDKLKGMAGWKMYEMTAGHDAMVDQPDRLTEILIEVA
jgi:pimeloyl-ACP methyl ester carboxylesterase